MTSTKVKNLGRILLFSYAFPPMQVPMTSVVIKPMAALARYGYDVDVLCCEPFSNYTKIDESLQSFADEHFNNIYRMAIPDTRVAKYWSRSPKLAGMPDLMGVMQNCAYQQMLKMDLGSYDAVLTWSPFHSINPVIERLKRKRNNFRWIAQFSDPWANNPLDQRKFVKWWSSRNEPKCLQAADYIVYSSARTRDSIIEKYGPALAAKSCVIPHPFEERLYPQRNKIEGARVKFTSVGTLFGSRSPEPLFKAISVLLSRRSDLLEKIAIEFVGPILPDMLQTEAALSLPKEIFSTTASTSYVESLNKMRQSDVLVLIEADVANNLFVPSKLSDYIGSNTPIIGITPPGDIKDILDNLGATSIPPNDIGGIADAIETAVDQIFTGPRNGWANATYRQKFSCDSVVQQFVSVIESQRMP